jgi:ABC-type Fe3+ transport system substrate-binding protein
MPVRKQVYMRNAIVVAALGALLLTACQPAPQASRSSSPAGQAPATGGAGAAGASASAPSDAHAAEIQRLLAAARANGETELNLSWTGTAIGPGDAHAQLAALFNRMYGTDLRITYTPGSSMQEMVGKIAQEATADRKASSDVVLGTERHFVDLLNLDVVERYDYTRLSPRITPEVVAHDNSGVEVYSTIPSVVYNTDLVAERDLPRRLEDVLQPQWQGKIASTSAAAYFDVVAMRPEWGTARMKAFVARLSQQVGGLLRAGDTPTIASGQFSMLVLGPVWATLEQKSKGAPLGFVIPEDAAGVRMVQMGVPRNSAHPNLAKLYINTLLTEEAQAILYRHYFNDNHGLPGSQSGAPLAQLRARGVEVLKVNSKFILDHPEIDALDSELADAIRRRD